MDSLALASHLWVEQWFSTWGSLGSPLPLENTIFDGLRNWDTAPLSRQVHSHADTPTCEYQGYSNRLRTTVIEEARIVNVAFPCIPEI